LISPKYVNILTHRKSFRIALDIENHLGLLYTTDRDGAGAQVVLKRGLAAVGHRVKMHRTASKFMGIPAKQESPHL
jgi:hypothetical protein